MSANDDQGRDAYIQELENSLTQAREQIAYLEGQLRESRTQAHGSQVEIQRSRSAGRCPATRRPIPRANPSQMELYHPPEYLENGSARQYDSRSGLSTPTRNSSSPERKLSIKFKVDQAGDATLRVFNNMEGQNRDPKAGTIWHRRREPQTLDGTAGSPAEPLSLQPLHLGYNKLHTGMNAESSGSPPPYLNLADQFISIQNDSPQSKSTSLHITVTNNVQSRMERLDTNQGEAVSHKIGSQTRWASATAIISTSSSEEQTRAEMETQQFIFGLHTPFAYEQRLDTNGKYVYVENMIQFDANTPLGKDIGNAQTQRRSGFRSAPLTPHVQTQHRSDCRSAPVTPRKANVIMGAGPLPHTPERTSNERQAQFPFHSQAPDSTQQDSPPKLPPHQPNNARTRRTPTNAQSSVNSTWGDKQENVFLRADRIQQPWL